MNKQEQRYYLYALGLFESYMIYFIGSRNKDKNFLSSFIKAWNEFINT